MAALPSGNLYDQFAPPERLTLLLEAMARGDEAEAVRLRGSCPRKTYTGPDIEFDERLSLAFDTVAVVCIDLRGLWGKLHVLHWAVASVRHFATLHHINADMAFLDGVRCGQRLPQLEFFARPLRPLPEGAAVAEEGQDADGSQVADDDDDETSDDGPSSSEEDEDGHADDSDDDSGLSGAGDDFPQRMGAVEDHAEHASAMIAVVLARAALDVARDLVDIWAAFDRFCRTRVGVPAKTMLNAWGGPLADDYEQAVARYPGLKPDPAKTAEHFGLICAAWDRRFGTGEDGDADGS